MNFRRKKREKLDITLISMIDVLFVLLLFFMVSTTFNRHTEVKIKLPEADGAEAEQYPKTVTLTIDADGTYYLDGNDGLPHKLVNQQHRNVKTGTTEACRTIKRPTIYYQCRRQDTSSSRDYGIRGCRLMSDLVILPLRLNSQKPNHEKNADPMGNRYLV